MVFDYSGYTCVRERGRAGRKKIFSIVPDSVGY
jgi:hypothetical protein